MKPFIHKSMALFMAALVFMTTTSFAVDMHFCGDTLVDFSFFQQVETCGMDKAQSPTDCEDPSLTQKSCCTDTQIIVDGQDDLKTSFEHLTLEQQVFVTSFTYAYIHLFEGTPSTDVSFLAYSPPTIDRDVQVLYQTFLI